MKSVMIMLAGALATWGSVSAANRGYTDRCRQIDAAAHSFAITTHAVPAFFAEKFHQDILNRFWIRLNIKKFKTDHPDLWARIKMAFKPRFVTMTDPHAYPGSFVQNAAFHEVMAAPDRLLIFVYDQNWRVPAGHPFHQAVQRTLRAMLAEGELVGVTENPNLGGPMKTVTSCE